MSLTEASIVALAPFARPRHDKTRDQWIINAPERVLVLEGPAHAIATRLKEPVKLAELIDGLAADFNAPRDVIAKDVLAFVTDLEGRGFIRHHADG